VLRIERVIESLIIVVSFLIDNPFLQAAVRRCIHRNAASGCEAGFDSVLRPLFMSTKGYMKMRQGRV